MGRVLSAGESRECGPCALAGRREGKRCWDAGPGEVLGPREGAGPLRAGGPRGELVGCRQGERESGPQGEVGWAWVFQGRLGWAWVEFWAGLSSNSFSFLFLFLTTQTI